MIVISDTNILSSLAAAQALPLLFQLFADDAIYIPPAVHRELQVGLARDKFHLESVLQTVASKQIQILPLSPEENRQLLSFPTKLNAGESEAIALAKTHHALFLSNDQRALNYCKRQNIQTFDLPEILRLLWRRKIVSQDEVRSYISMMREVEKLNLGKSALEFIFAPRKRRRKKR